MRYDSLLFGAHDDDAGTATDFDGGEKERKE